MFPKIHEITAEELEHIETLPMTMTGAKKSTEAYLITDKFNDWAGFMNSGRNGDTLMHAASLNSYSLQMQLVNSYNGPAVGCDHWLLVYTNGDGAINLDNISPNIPSRFSTESWSLMKFQREVLAYLLPRRGYANVSPDMRSPKLAPLNTLIHRMGPVVNFDTGFLELLQELAEEGDGPGTIARMITGYRWVKRGDDVRRVPYGGEDKDWDYFRVVGSGAISYLPKKTTYDENRVSSPWERSNRVQQKAGRFVRAYFTEEQMAAHGIGDKEIEAFSIVLQTGVSRPLDNTYLVKGEDIRYWYDGDRYYDDAGELNSSCMRYDHCQSYMDVYVENPKQVEMLIVTTGDIHGDEYVELMARGLVWTDVEGDRYLDRVYGTYKMIPRVYKHAESLGIENLRDSDRHITVKLDKPWHSMYPYFDSMGLLYGDGTLRNYEDYDERYIGLHNTGGGPHLTGSQFLCRSCGNMDIGGNNRNGYCQSCRAEQMKALTDTVLSPGSRCKEIRSNDMLFLEDAGHAVRLRVNERQFVRINANGHIYEVRPGSTVYRRVLKSEFTKELVIQRRTEREMERRIREANKSKQKIRNKIEKGIFPGTFDIVSTLRSNEWSWVGDYLALRINGSPYRVMVHMERNPGETGYTVLYTRTEIYNGLRWSAV